jgi:hypothetical protein
MRSRRSERRANRCADVRSPFELRKSGVARDATTFWQRLIAEALAVWIRDTARRPKP